MNNSMSRAEFKMLERIFTAEVDHAFRKARVPYCFQSKAKIMQTLEEKGLVESVSFRVGNDALACTVEGWQLSHLGRLTYCASCVEV